MSHFQTRVKNFFCHPGKFLFPPPFRTWPARWRERLYAPFRPHRQAFFRKKSKKCFRTVKKALPRHGSLIFNPLSKIIRLCAKKVKYFILFFSFLFNEIIRFFGKIGKTFVALSAKNQKNGFSAVFPMPIIVPTIEAVWIAAVGGVPIGLIGIVLVFLFEVFLDEILDEVLIRFND